MLALINRGALYKSAELISKLYRSYVRLHLEYCIQFWTLINAWCKYVRKDPERVFKIIPNLGNLLYKERLQRLDMFYLKVYETQGWYDCDV